VNIKRIVGKKFYFDLVFYVEGLFLDETEVEKDIFLDEIISSMILKDQEQGFNYDKN